MNARSVGLYYSEHLATNTKISPDAPETHCSREIGYRFFFGYYYTDGFRCPMITPFFHHFSFTFEANGHWVHTEFHLLLLQAIISSDPRKT
jgi:hypothetical protein